ncbi:MAG: hypothetical protein IT305_21190 [Chloroflexi bacterium]|nr:hypothetical protein [Chloroflexota bacterium]
MAGQDDTLQDVRVVHFGLGPLGAEIARLVAERPGVVSVAAIDADPARAGRDLGDVAGLGQRTRIVVSEDPDLLEELEADVVLYVASESSDTLGDLEACLESGLNVVAVCQELTYPPEDAEDDDLVSSIDSLAEEADVSILTVDESDALFGTLILPLTATSRDVERVAIRRTVLRTEVGRYSVADWARTLADTLGWSLDEIDEAEDGVGGHHVVGRMNGMDVVTVALTQTERAADANMEIQIVGQPTLMVSASGGPAVEQALAALVVNAIPQVLMGDAGLLTLADMPPIHCWTSMGLVAAADTGEDDDEEDE